MTEITKHMKQSLELAKASSYWADVLEGTETNPWTGVSVFLTAEERSILMWCYQWQNHYYKKIEREVEDEVYDSVRWYLFALNPQAYSVLLLGL